MFRPCIDLHDGRVKQIVGGSLTEDGAGLRTNFVSERPAAWFADRYRQDGLTGGHVILLGPGNEAAAREALSAYPDGLQLGGGVNADNACAYRPSARAASPRRRCSPTSSDGLSHPNSCVVLTAMSRADKR